jgi:hypothetical protein
MRYSLNGKQIMKDSVQVPTNEEVFAVMETSRVLI